MSVWQCTPTGTPLYTSEGELVSISVSVEPRRLESLLDALGHISFPVNPRICHPQHACDPTVVEFPGYSSGLDEVGRVLGAWGFAAGSMRVTRMLEEIRKP